MRRLTLAQQLALQWARAQLRPRPGEPREEWDGSDPFGEDATGEPAPPVAARELTDDDALDTWEMRRTE